jgi:hypothetical protein
VSPSDLMKTAVSSDRSVNISNSTAVCISQKIVTNVGEGCKWKNIRNTLCGGCGLQRCDAPSLVERFQTFTRIV